MKIFFSLMFLFFIHLSHLLFISAKQITKQNEIKEKSVTPNAHVNDYYESCLKFYLLGDWGKGGNSGSYWNKGIDELNKESHTDIQSQLPLYSNAGGDGGGGGGGGGKKQDTLYQAAVAKAMSKYGSNSNPTPSFVVALGDNFYTNGVTSYYDSSWTYLWESVYLGYDALQIPWYPVFGNHDYNGYPKAQLDRTTKYPDGYWQFPAANYTKIFDIPGDEGGTVQIVFIDTTTLAPSACDATNSKGGVSSSTQYRLIQNQLQHITKILDDTILNPPTWLIVAGHYPIYSIGEHGDSSELKTYLSSLLPQYNVHAYICGHDHISEHLYKDGTHHFVSGAGSMTGSLSSYTTSASVLWTGTGYSAFSVMTATTETLSISFIDTSGSVKYSYTMSNPMTSYPTKYPTESPTITQLDSISPSLPSSFSPTLSPTNSSDPVSPVNGNSYNNSSTQDSSSQPTSSSSSSSSSFSHWIGGVDSISYGFGIGMSLILLFIAIIGFSAYRRSREYPVTTTNNILVQSKPKNTMEYKKSQSKQASTAGIEMFGHSSPLENMEEDIEVGKEGDNVTICSNASSKSPSISIQTENTYDESGVALIHQGTYSPTAGNVGTRLNSRPYSPVPLSLRSTGLFSSIAIQLTSTNQNSNQNSNHMSEESSLSSLSLYRKGHRSKTVSF